MYTIDRFFGTTLQKGTLGFGWFTIIYAIVATLLSLYSVSVGSIFWSFIDVACGILLIIAARKESPRLLIPWLAIKAFQIVIGIPIAVLILIWDFKSQLGVLFSSLIFLAIYTCLLCYGWIGVHSYYRQLKGEDQYTTTSASSPRGQV